MSAKKTEKLAIIGGGISGLVSAYTALKNGVPAENITIYDAANRTNGVIFNREFEGQAVNMGAEFVDTDNKVLRDLISELGLKEIKAKDMDNEVFQRKDGGLIEANAFYAELNPLRQIINADTKEALAKPDGELAKRLDNLSFDDYLKEVQQRYNQQHPKSYLRAFIDLITFTDSQDKTEILDIVRGSFRSEFGNHPSKCSALQCAFELAEEPDSILRSDCAFRIEGGSEKLLEALKAKLKDINIVTDHRLADIRKDDSGYHMGFKGQEEEVRTDKIIMTIPGYAYKNINGLDQIMPKEVYDTMANVQYTNNNLKVTVKTRDDYTPPERCVFSALGLQSWVPGNLKDDGTKPNTMTFLVHRDDGESVSVAIRRTLDAAAKAEGTSPDKMFAVNEENRYVLTHVAPTASGSCYAAAGLGDALALRRAKMKFAEMESNGLGVASTAIPISYGEGMGFMVSGVAAAQHAADQLVPRQQGMNVALDQSLTPSVHPAHTQASWQARVKNQESPGYLAV